MPNDTQFQINRVYRQHLELSTLAPVSPGSRLCRPHFNLAAKENAEGLACYVAGYFNRVMGGRMVVSATVEEEGGLLPGLEVRFLQGQLTFRGTIVLDESDEHRVVGLAINGKGGQKVFFPSRPPTKLIVTQSGSYYVLWADGASICISKEGARRACARITFIPPDKRDRAEQVVQQSTGRIPLLPPTVGHHPVQIGTPGSKSSDRIGVDGGFIRWDVKPSDWRVGSPVTQVYEL